ncbi:MAG TPA: LysM peptidoglycan-binding domain-containing protein [Glaciibacter sp.]|nr:LysM peptidoglycan-binding domain-containing protein [Glaciibacter sp.]
MLLSAIAMTFHIATPADASTQVKRQVKPKSPSTERFLGSTARAQVAASVQGAPATYVVADGDTVSGIAARFGLSTASVLAQNGLSWSSVIFPGQVLTLSQAAPQTAAPATQPVAAELTRHTVVSGDTISGIAGAHGVPVAAVLSANGLGASSVIYPGQAIVIPSAGSVPAAIAPVAPAARSAGTTHTIESGDTISGVAAAAGISVQALLDANGLGWSSIIYPGQVLTVPSPNAAPAAAVMTPAVYVTPDASGPVNSELTPEMRGNAEIIISVGRSAGVPDYGLVIALAAAAQESGLRNVQYGDRDSLGLFQQRPSAGWGTPEQVLDPVRSSQAFFGGPGNPNPGVTRGLLDIPSWESMTVTQAAQAVQISAYPDHYAKWEAPAWTWLAQLG